MIILILYWGGVDHFARNRVYNLEDKVEEQYRDLRIKLNDARIFQEFSYLENIRLHSIRFPDKITYNKNVYQFELDNKIRWKHAAFGQDMDGNEIWAVCDFQDRSRLHIIPNGTFSEMKAAINNVITLKDISDICGIACEDKNWYIYESFRYYKFQIKQSNGKYSYENWEDNAERDSKGNVLKYTNGNIKYINPFPVSHNQDGTERLKENLKKENWRWDGDPGQWSQRQYLNNITFIKSRFDQVLSYEYNGQEQKQFYNGYNIWGLCYNQKGRVMICDDPRLVLITIPELYFREILP